VVRHAREPGRRAGHADMSDAAPAGEPIHYRVSHRTTYEYAEPMTDGYTLAYLLPRPTRHQVVERAEVEVTPEPDERAEHIDSFGNRVLQIGVHHSHDSLSLHAMSTVAIEPGHVDGPGEPWEAVAARVRTLRGGDALTVRPFAGSSPYVPLDRHGEALRTLAEEAFTPHRPVVDGARDLCHLIYSTFEYDPAFTEVSTPLSAVLEARRGVCQDFAHVAVAALRSLGLAARYVSGYIETTPPPGQPKLVGVDASHAWASVWVPRLGWIDFDPTNDQVPPAQHVSTAWGRDYRDVAPVRGVVIGPPSTQTLTVSVDVSREDELGVMSEIR
jgi:transglutaminase-like putative cysteine protease